MTQKKESNNVAVVFSSTFFVSFSHQISNSLIIVSCGDQSSDHTQQSRSTTDIVYHHLNAFSPAMFRERESARVYHRITQFNLQHNHNLPAAFYPIYSLFAIPLSLSLCVSFVFRFFLYGLARATYY